LRKLKREVFTHLMPQSVEEILEPEMEPWSLWLVERLKLYKRLWIFSKLIQVMWSTWELLELVNIPRLATR
jgi:hypothetical protein